MNETMFVADLETRHPPVLHVRMITVTDVYRTPTAGLAFIAVIEVLQAMQVVQVPKDGSVLAIDLKRVKGFVAAGITGRLERGERTVLEAREESACIIDADFLHLASELMRPLLHERLSHGADFINAPVEPDGGVDAVREQIAGHAGAGGLHVQTPKRGAALWQFGIDGPILQELGAIMENAAQAALIDQLLGEGHRRHAPV